MDGNIFVERFWIQPGDDRKKSQSAKGCLAHWDVQNVAHLKSMIIHILIYGSITPGNEESSLAFLNIDF